MKLVRVILILLFLSFAGCSSLVLKPVDFAWPVESVLHVDNNGFVKEDRHTLYFNVKPLFLEETEGDSIAYLDKDIRIIRDTKGYYFVTAKNFKNVYVFVGTDGELKLDNKIEMSEKEGMSNPAFNQRIPYVELVDNGKKTLLSNEGIESEDKNEK
jgi:hypothetical protein